MKSGRCLIQEKVFSKIYIKVFLGSSRTVSWHQDITRVDRAAGSLVGGARDRLDRHDWGCRCPHGGREGGLWCLLYVTSSDVWFLQAPSNKSAHSAHSMDWTSYHALEDIYGWSDFLFWGDNLHFVDQPFDLGLITLIRLLTSARRRLLGRPMKARTW